MISNLLRALLGALLTLVAVLAFPAGTAAHAAGSSAQDGRVVILGFDGADARTVRELTEANPEDYPTFRRLMDQGTFGPMLVEAPPESPVAWAALNTGQNPAKTGVPGFIKVVREGVSAPFPFFGHIEIDKPADISTLDNAPIPTWSASTMAAVFGGATALVVLFILAVVVKMSPAIAIAVSLLLGGAAGFAGYTIRGYLPESYPRTGNPNKARNFWDYGAEAGKKLVVLNAAQAFDMEAPEGAEVLAGLGLPDAKNALGEWAIYTTNEEEFQRPPKGNTDNTPTAGVVYRVDELGGEIQTEIFGPKNFWLIDKLQAEIDAIDAKLSNPADIDIEKSIELSDRQRTLEDERNEVRDRPTSVPMNITKRAGEAQITIGEQTQVVKEGEWSGFYELTFALNPILEVHALTRVKVVHLDDPHFELFVNVLDIDPRRPPFWQQVSTPFEFSNELAMRCGLYETYGWPTATMPLKDGAIAPETLMEDVEFTMKWRERLLEDQMSRTDWDCLFSVFSTTDRVQHMMYQYWDEGHPLHKGEVAEAADRTMVFYDETIRLGDAIPVIYQHMDRIIGNVLDNHIGPNDTLMVVADHGFQTFRYQVNLNSWLVDNGYAALKPGIKRSDRSNLGDWVDWSKTQVYSLGMGFMYVNLKGREPQGIVEPDEVDALLARLKADLLEARDPERDRKIVNDVYVTKEIHSGPHLGMEGDMLIGFAPEYRIAWDATGGGVSLSTTDGITGLGPILYDNDSAWSGGHVSVALPDVAAVFFSNRQVEVPEGGFRSLHIAPTALDLMGVPVPPEMDLPPLVVQ